MGNGPRLHGVQPGGRSHRRRVAEEGYTDRIVIGQDIATKHRLVKYGGHGYGHILENIVPKMRRRGFSEDAIRAITVDNPASILALV